MSNKIILGLSGGVDSAYACRLLQREGCEVLGVFLRMHDGADSGPAREAARRLGIAMLPDIDLRERFARDVIAPFAEAYLSGRTPNPCVLCNRRVKFAALLQAAREAGAAAAATGHYARVERDGESGRWYVAQAADGRKDQSYMLCNLTQEELAAARFPLGEMRKEDVKRLAAEAGIMPAGTPESQEICFIGAGESYADYVVELAARRNLPLPPEGDFVDGVGNVLGRHRGIQHYTIGQRRGLGIALGHNMYVRRIDAASDTVELTPDENGLYSDAIVIGDVNWMRAASFCELAHAGRLTVKIRSAATPVPVARVEELESGRLRIEAERPLKSAAPGQAAALYMQGDGSVLLGGFVT